jgi:hypothetical protein
VEGKLEMTAERNGLLDELLGPLHMHFLSARAAYQDYLATGKSFLFANCLRRTNASARDLLINKGYLLPEQNQADATALIRHYDVWLTLWDDLARRDNPQLDDCFAFDNKVTYPKDAARELDRLYAQLSS